MGFFSSFSSIGKIYDKLKVIERDLADMQECLQNPYRRSGFNSASSQGLQHLKELMALVNNSGNTVQCADFEFAGQKRPIANHVYAIFEYMKQMMAEYTFNCNNNFS